METYSERVLRFRILRHEDLPESHKEIYRSHGEDPDNIWSLIWSFNDKEAAEKCFSDLQNDPGKPSFWSYKLVDNGEESVIERPIY